MPVPKWGIWSQEGGGGRGGARRALCAIGLRAAAGRRAGPGTDASSGSAGGGRRRVLNRKCAACSATVPLPAAPRRPSRRAPSPAAAAAQDSLRAGFGPIPPPGVSACARPLETRPRPRPAADPAARKPTASGGCARSSTCFAKHRSPRSCPAPRAHSNPPRERCAALGASRVSPSPPPPPHPPPPTPPGFFQVHQGLHSGSAVSACPPAAGNVGLLRLRKELGEGEGEGSEIRTRVPRAAQNEASLEDPQSPDRA
ncbi:uncharacterized protein LOC116418878 [Piliocolobus tephrosceles]|uniref:uncharacterized protein LOC116418878 n=1 Tax=Piliocolobus tephrosceles TaxID=591936 RepID=UPI001301694C|nr:uncharacterized protein LOC116418878 [Piliocolobus tephrosceles]